MADKKGQTIIIKRIKKGGHGHHGGAWKVAFADFMTAMMMFFLVMWLLGTDAEVQKSITDYFAAPQTSQWRKDMETTRPAVLGDMTAAGESVLNGAQGQVPDTLVQQPKRVVNSRTEVEESQALEAVVNDEAVMSLDRLEFTVPEDQIFTPGTMAEWTPQAQKFLAKIGRLTRLYKGKLTIRWDYDNSIQGSDVAGSYEFQNNRAVVLKHHLVDHNYAEEDRVATDVVPQRRPSSAGPALRRIQFVLNKE